MKKQTAGRDNLGSLAPQFAALNDDVLFGEVWAREEELSPKNRSMITIAALFSAGQFPQLKAHLALCSDEIPESVREHYKTLSHHAGECIKCGACETRCPFEVEIRKNMDRAVEVFGY